MTDGQRQIPDSVEEIIDEVEEAGARRERVSVGDVVDEIGAGAFPVIMLVPALVMISPASGIPGLSSVCAAIIALSAVQMAIGRRSIWLPKFIVNRTVSRSRMDTAMHWLERPARWIDHVTRKRLSALTRRPANLLPVLACIVIALVVPALELVPFSASAAGAAIALFSLGLVAEDGLFVLVGFVAMAGAAALGWWMMG